MPATTDPPGLRKLILIAMATVLVTAPFLFLEIRSERLYLARDAEDAAHISFTVDEADGRIRCRGRFNNRIPENADLVAELVVRAGNRAGPVLTRFHTDRLRLDEAGDRRTFTIVAPARRTTAAAELAVELVFSHEGEPILYIRGRRQPGTARLQAVEQRKPEDDAAADAPP